MSKSFFYLNYHYLFVFIGEPRKYTRDHESDWVIKNEEPHYGFKEHAAVDIQYCFILSTTLSPSSHNDSKYRYIVEQYFGISHLHDNGDRARFPQLMKNIIDIMFRQFAFNLKKGAKILEVIPV